MIRQGVGISLKLVVQHRVWKVMRLIRMRNCDLTTVQPEEKDEEVVEENE